MNALALNSVDTTSTPRGNALGAYFTETRYELIRMIRNPGVAVPVLAMPLALYLLFALVIAGEAIDKDPNLGIFLFAAFSIMAVTMQALFGTGVTLALERDMGLLRLKRAQPAPPAAWVVAKIASGFVLAVLAYVPIVIMALATGKLALAPGQVAAFSGALLVGSIPFCAMGLMVGSLASGTTAPGYSLLIYLPGCYLSGMFFPLPKSMYWEAPIWPQFQVEQFAMHLAGITKFQQEPLLTAIATMVGYTTMFAAITVWRLSRKG
ncbi:MAG TPA: ABC transporter permease [Steroidobacteraceae bacterium]|jgi:ABC-2 type transport system permease protein|nr:ABC transporter permease [Steroidobacteraceae bacterium]